MQEMRSFLVSQVGGKMLQFYTRLSGSPEEDGKTVFRWCP